jgi:hypothetical protein
MRYFTLRRFLEARCRIPFLPAREPLPLTSLGIFGMVALRIGGPETIIMEKDKLQKLIARLHEEISAADTIDDRSRALLKDLTGDIDALAAPGDEADSASGQLEEAALKFKSEHPKLSMALGELVDALGKLGI